MREGQPIVAVDGQAEKLANALWTKWHGTTAENIPQCNFEKRF